MSSSIQIVALRMVGLCKSLKNTSSSTKALIELLPQRYINLQLLVRHLYIHTYICVSVYIYVCVCVHMSSAAAPKLLALSISDLV